MTRLVLLEDYLDQARHLPCVQALARRVDLQIYTTKTRFEAETIERTRQPLPFPLFHLRAEECKALGYVRNPCLLWM